MGMADGERVLRLVDLHAVAAGLQPARD
jgi:hypothetical protein